MLRFTQSNAKLNSTMIFSLPAGHMCPAASACLAKADRITGKVTDGPDASHRCFGASCEARSTALRKLVWGNADQILNAVKRGPKAIADLIDNSMPDWSGLVRIHSTGGDFFTKSYLQGWLEVARRRPGKIIEFNGKKQVVGTVFYAYTRMIPFFIGTELPKNFFITASVGGLYDDKIPESGLKCVHTLFRESDAAALGLEIDHDDTHAWAGTKDFALIIHGTQPAFFEASRAREENRKAGKFTGYMR
jgi:hypothetical protein